MAVIMQYTSTEMAQYEINSAAGPPVLRDTPVETKRPVPMDPPRALDQLISMTILLKRTTRTGGPLHIQNLHHLDMAVFQTTMCRRVASIEQIFLDETASGAIFFIDANLHAGGIDLFGGRRLILYVHVVAFGGLVHD